jgi:3-oxoacyl-(acyl-carrier-protein) synthase
MIGAMKTVVLARAQWPTEDLGAERPAVAELPPVAGFIESAFSPLVAAVADLCLASYFGVAPVGLACGERTAIVLASATGDQTTAAAVAGAVQAGRRVPPLLFYQSNPNAVAGYVAARWGLAGPVVCIMPGGAVEDGPPGDTTSRVLAEATATADALIDDGDADAALVIAANADLSGAAWGIAELIGPPWWSSRPASEPGGTARNRGAQ